MNVVGWVVTELATLVFVGGIFAWLQSRREILSKVGDDEKERILLSV